MIRQAFIMWLKPGGSEEYRRLHGEVPRQVELDEEAAGVVRETIWLRGEMLFVVSEVRDELTWERARHSLAGQEWAATLTPYLVMDDTGSVKTELLEEVYDHTVP